MNFFERELANLERRIKKISDNPDPSKLKSNKMLFEIEAELRRDQIQAWEEGRPFACGDGFAPLLRAMGFVFLDSIRAADRSPEMAEEFLAKVRADGLPDWGCDRVILVVPMALSGDLPLPVFVAGTNWSCDVIAYSNNYIAKVKNIPNFFVTVHYEPNKEAVKYLVGQLKEMIEYIEKNVPGAKFDEDKLAEGMHLQRKQWEIMRDIYKLKGRVPCPIGPRDSFREERWITDYTNPYRGLEYNQALRDELYERANSGDVPIQDEKLRIGWVNTGPMFSERPFRMLQERGVSIPIFLHGSTARLYHIWEEEWEYEQTLSPLEDLAWMLLSNSWAGLGDKWSKDVIRFSKELKIDALVDFRQTGCIQTVAIGKVLSDDVERELGIPMLVVEGRGLIQEGFDVIDFEHKVMDFVDMCIKSKNVGK